MSEERLRGEEYRTTVVCIDSYENAVPSGRLYNPYLKGGKSFQSTTQLLSEIERLLDRMNFPAAFTATRMFSAPAGYGAGPPPISCESGTTATFAVKILFRQHASWPSPTRWPVSP